MGWVDAGYYVQGELSYHFSEFDPDVLFSYLDDVVFGTDEFDPFVYLLRRVLETLRRLVLTCKREKCGFGLKKLPVL